MKDQRWYVALLIGLMCLIRFSMGVAGYADPPWLMEQLHIPADLNIHMPYVARVWAIRDIALAVMVAFANKNSVKTLLLACIVIDTSDVLSAHLSGMAGLFSASETWLLKLTAIAALIPEVAALVLITIRKTEGQVDSEKKQVNSPNTVA
jgi:preprotein translocase subunit SecG